VSSDKGGPCGRKDANQRVAVARTTIRVLCMGLRLTTKEELVLCKVRTRAWQKKKRSGRLTRECDRGLNVNDGLSL
jgi:hypothetical protein